VGGREGNGGGARARGIVAGIPRGWGWGGANGGLCVLRAWRAWRHRRAGPEPGCAGSGRAGPGRAGAEAGSCLGLADVAEAEGVAGGGDLVRVVDPGHPALPREGEGSRGPALLGRRGRAAVATAVYLCRAIGLD
jgi:hypothetical protein